MLIRQVKDDTGWKKLLAYYIDCLREESRLHHVIEPEDIQKTCWFLPRTDGSFLRNAPFFSISIQQNRETEVERLQRFVLGEPRSEKRPHVCFGYPFFVDLHRNLIPLFYVDVSGRQIDKGVWLTSKSPEVEINFAALREVLSEGLDDDEKEISRDKALVEFGELESESSKTRFDQALGLFLSRLEKSSGKPVVRVSRKQFESRSLPRHAVVECPLLFYARADGTNQLLRELRQLKEEHDWNAVQPALRHLLSKSSDEPYPEASELGDPHLYIVPANDSQRKAVAAAGQCSLTVVTSPPETEMDRYQLVLNVVGDTVFRGETVLIVSLNNGVVDAVSEHFLNKLDYPGVVRSGGEFSQPVSTTMRRALAVVREGDIVSRLEQVRGEYDEMVRQIDGQKDGVALTERLEQEQEIRQLEIQEHLEALPESIRTSVERDGICLDKDDEQQLSAAIGALLEDVQNVIAQRQALAEKVQATLLTDRSVHQMDMAVLEELEDIEQRLGISISLRRSHVDLDSSPAIESYVSAWEDWLQTLALKNNVRWLHAEIDAAEQQAESQRNGLPSDLSAALDGAVTKFDEQREQSLRQGLEAIEREAREAARDYRQLVETIDDLWKRSDVVARWLLAATALQIDDSSTLRLEDILDKGFAMKNDVLSAHRLGTAQSDIAEQSNLWRQDREGKIAESHGLLTRLDKELGVVQSQVPALLLPRIEAALEVADHQAWHNLAAQLAKIDIWVARVELGNLTFGERLRRIGSRRWAVKHLSGELNALRVSNADLFALNPIEEPPDTVSLEPWAEHVRTWNKFAQACALATQRAYVQQTLVSYQAQSEDEINARSVELQEAETGFTNLLARLPETIAEAMAENTWPFGPLDETIVHNLDELEGRYQNLKAQYEGWVKRLAMLQRGQTLPRALQSAIRALSSDGKRRTGQDVSRATPLAVLDLVSTWLHFSRATEAEYKLRRLRSSLAEAETSLDAFWAKLPDGMRRELDGASVPHSDDLLRPLQQLVSSLRTEMVPQVEEWNRIQERTIALLRHNELKSRALDRSLKKAQKDPSYLSELLNKTYEHPEQLLDDLQIWQQVIQVWLLRAQQTQARAQSSKERSAQDKGQAALDRLWERRRDLAGQILAEQWRHIAAELEPPTIHSIDQYLSAIEALAAGDANLDDLKQRAEAHYHDVLELFPVWLTTDLSTPAIPLQAGLFDCVVIDEACLCDIPSALPWLFRAKRIVVIGDERQPSYTVTLADSVNRQFSERHDIGVGTKYDRSRSLFNLAADSVAGRPGQIALDNGAEEPERS